MAVIGYTTLVAGQVGYGFTPLLKVPPASRGEPCGDGFARFARGTAWELGSSASRGEPCGDGFARFARGTDEDAPIRFPLRAGGTLRRGSNKT
jgi:hypothetical protein